MTTACIRPFLSLCGCVLVLSACGTNKQAQENCRINAYNAAELRAVSRLYDAGKLGTQKQIERELGVPGRPGSSFFDRSGHLLPYDRLDLDHRVQIVLWLNNGRVARLTYDARKRARARTHPDC